MRDSQKEHISEQRRTGMRPLYLGFLLGGVMIFFFLNLMLGSVDIPVGDILKILIGGQTGHLAWQKIIINIRIPRALTAILAGSALSVGGLQMQTFFRNPLAGPSVLGITSGASLGVAIVMLAAGTITSIFAIQQLSALGSWIIVGAASLGSAAVLLLILLISLKVRDNVTLLIIGLMIGNITIAMVSIWQYFSQPEQIRDYLIWTFGSLGGVPLNRLWILAIAVIVGGIIAVGMSKSLNGLLLG
ncbi:MAG TPA: iron chelate uptake ABC transporter family permease subunit, partial [Balneolaceae bacterium]|nr:iron chelate uptake ABC transporter family permease subunit [Balneolaceae bacterium]